MTMGNQNPFVAIALRYLGRRIRTQFQVKQYLQKRGANSQQLDETMHKLADFNVLNDGEYAQVLVRSYLKKGKGVNFINQTLKRHGIDQNTIDSVISEISQTSLTESAIQLARRYAQNRRLTNTLKDKAKIYRFLASRGFSSSQIRQAIDSIPHL